MIRLVPAGQLEIVPGTFERIRIRVRDSPARCRASIAAAQTCHPHNSRESIMTRFARRNLFPLVAGLGLWTAVLPGVIRAQEPEGTADPTLRPVVGGSRG